MATRELEPLLDATVTIPDHVVRRSFGGETIVLNLETGQYHGLNATAAAMLERLERGESPGAAAAAIAGLAGVAIGRVRADIVALLRNLADRGLVEVGGGRDR